MILPVICVFFFLHYFYYYSEEKLFIVAVLLLFLSEMSVFVMLWSLYCCYRRYNRVRQEKNLSTISHVFLLAPTQKSKSCLPYVPFLHDIQCQMNEKSSTEEPKTSSSQNSPRLYDAPGLRLGSVAS